LMEKGGMQILYKKELKFIKDNSRRFGHVWKFDTNIHGSYHSTTCDDK
jgi:hypothetical protein